MQQDDKLPPNPSGSDVADFRPGASDLPPFESDMLELENRSGRRLAGILSFSGMSPITAIAIIFIGSFLIGVLFTSSILAGIIEIHPSVIKGFLKSLIGKS